MMRMLSDCVYSRDNNLNLIRFVAASAVLVSHSYALVAGTGHAEPFRQTLGKTLGSMSVDIFFIVSGLLVAASFDRTRDWLDYALARVLRIWPALIVAMIFCVFFVGLSFTTLTPVEYLSNPDTYLYLVRNMILFAGVEHYLPGVFLDNPYIGAVNGSLWTLPHEVRLYVVLLGVFVLGSLLEERYSKFRLDLTVFSGFTLLTLVLVSKILMGENISNTLSLSVFFFSGVTLFLFRDHVKISWRAGALLLLVLAAAYAVGKFLLAYYFVLPYLILVAAYLPHGKILEFNRFGDYSYGVYIYAFPIQQLLINIQPTWSVFQNIIGSFVLTLVLAIGSWHLVEHPMLRYKHNGALKRRIGYATGWIANRMRSQAT